MITNNNNNHSLENYQKLTEFLKGFENKISKEQFKAIIFAMYLLSNTTLTKKNAYIIVKRKFINVPTVFINSIIKQMRFVSVAQLSNRVILKTRYKHLYLDLEYKKSLIDDRQTNFL